MAGFPICPHPLANPYSCPMCAGDRKRHGLRYLALLEQDGAQRRERQHEGRKARSRLPDLSEFERLRLREPRDG